MNRVSLIAIAAFINVLMVSCNSNRQAGNESNQGDEKGIGKFKEVKLTHPLDEAMITAGQTIYQTKCFACHKLTDEKLVGPGWKGVTDRRTPEWIMNFITNTNVMLDSDLVAQQLMVMCLVRMPNQTLKDDDARDVLEFMRKNDGKN